MYYFLPIIGGVLCLISAFLALAQGNKYSRNVRLIKFITRSALGIILITFPFTPRYPLMLEYFETSSYDIVDHLGAIFFLMNTFFVGEITIQVLNLKYGRCDISHNKKS